MEVTEKDKELMIELMEKHLNEVLEKIISGEDRDYVIFPMGIYLGCNKGEALDIYKDFKTRGKKVYFISDEGMWLLDNKGDLNLVQKQERFSCK